MSEENKIGIPELDPRRTPMDKHTYLLVKLQEECLEIAHAASKAITFGLGERLAKGTATNQQSLRSEILDLLTIIDMLSANGVELDIRHDHPFEITHRKRKVAHYARYSELCGTLKEQIPVY